MSRRDEWLKQHIVEIITSFEREQMSVVPESVSLDLHAQSLVVTFRGAACPADTPTPQLTGTEHRIEDQRLV